MLDSEVIKSLLDRYHIKEVSSDEVDLIRVECPICGGETTLEVTEPELEKFLNGVRIQTAMPQRENSYREAIQTGICIDCWTKIEESSQS